MNLKEAFRYQNKLQSFLDEAQSTLDRDSNVTRVENTYLRHKVMAEAEDETVLAMPETEYYRELQTLPASSCTCWTRKASCLLPSARQSQSWISTWTARSASMQHGRASPAHSSE